MKILFVLFVLLVSNVSVHAADFGRWLCTECVGQIASTKAHVAVEAAGEIAAFIKAVVNPNAHPPAITGIPSGGWKPGDSVTICDGAWCTTLFYSPSGVFIPTLVPFRDPQSKYKNSSSTISFYIVGGSSYSVTGHNEWTDYYSDGEYTGSDFDGFVIDSISIGADLFTAAGSYRVQHL